MSKSESKYSSITLSIFRFYYLVDFASYFTLLSTVTALRGFLYSRARYSDREVMNIIEISTSSTVNRYLLRITSIILCKLAMKKGQLF